MDLKKGMIVKIISEPADDWTQDMNEWCNKIVSIHHCRANGEYIIKEDRVHFWLASDFVPASNFEISKYVQETYRKTLY